MTRRAESLGERNMPNHCVCKLTIWGPEEDVAKLVREAADDASLFSFEVLVPATGDFLEKSLQHDATWGVSRPAYDVTRAHNATDVAEWSLTTAWGPADAFFQKLSTLRPTLSIALSFGEEYPTRGRRLWRAGREDFVETEGSKDFEAFARERDLRLMTDEDRHATVVAWRDLYLRSHDAWVTAARFSDLRHALRNAQTVAEGFREMADEVDDAWRALGQDPASVRETRSLGDAIRDLVFRLKAEASRASP